MKTLDQKSLLQRNSDKLRNGVAFQNTSTPSVSSVSKTTSDKATTATTSEAVMATTTPQSPFSEAAAQIKEAGSPVSPPASAGRQNDPTPREARARPRHDPNRPLSEMPAHNAVDRLNIPRDRFPDGMDLQWVTSTVAGQSFPQHRQGHERRGWQPVHQEDFEGKYDGLFMAPGAPGEITVDGLVLMARPLAWSNKAKMDERREAASAVLIKEENLRTGQLEGVGMDGGSQHPSALRSNYVNRQYGGLPTRSGKVPSPTVTIPDIGPIPD